MVQIKCLLVLSIIQTCYNGELMHDNLVCVFSNQLYCNSFEYMLNLNLMGLFKCFIVIPVYKSSQSKVRANDIFHFQKYIIYVPKIIKLRLEKSFKSKTPDLLKMRPVFKRTIQKTSF